MNAVLLFLQWAIIVYRLSGWSAMPCQMPTWGHKIIDFIWIFWILLLYCHGPALSSTYYEDIKHINKWENLILIYPMMVSKSLYDNEMLCNTGRIATHLWACRSAIHGAERPLRAGGSCERRCPRRVGVWVRGFSWADRQTDRRTDG